jgi:hypothetical protein
MWLLWVVFNDLKKFNEIRDKEAREKKEKEDQCRTTSSRGTTSEQEPGPKS